MDKLIQRARALIIFMSEEDAAAMLMDTGVDAGDAFLAVKAAVILERS